METKTEDRVKWVSDTSTHNLENLAKINSQTAQIDTQFFLKKIFFLTFCFLSCKLLSPPQIER